MVTVVITFVVLALVIIAAGTYLAKFADELGELTGMGGSMAGLVLLAFATSLPELVVGCSAAYIGAPNLTVGDLLGSSLFNLLILAVLDLLYRTSGRMLSPAGAAHALSATASLVLTAIVLVFLLIDVPFSLGRLGFGSVAIALTYVAGLRLVYFDQRVGRVVAEVIAEHAAETTSMKRAVTGYLICTAVILVAAPLLARTADRLAIDTGLGGTFVGTAFVALVTSLPEVTTTRAAMRMGAFEMAIGNVLGSNSFNMVILVAVDLVYGEPLLASVSETHAITAALVILVTAVTTLSLLYPKFVS